MTPKTRTELFINAILGNEESVPVPLTRIEMYLKAIFDNVSSVPKPQTREEMFLYKIAGNDDIVLPIPKTREEMYYAKIALVDIDTPAPKTRLEWFLNEWAIQAQIQYSTVTGNPVSFVAYSKREWPLRQLQVAFSPVQSGSGDPSPDNVRPISGWSSLTVEQRGKNLLQVTPYGGSLYGRNVGTDLKNAGGTVAECSVSGNRITVNVTNDWISGRLVATPPLPAGTYTINLGSKPTNGRIYWCITDEDLVVVSQATSAQTKTLLDGQRIAIVLTATPAGEVWFDDVQVELGESYTSSAPINTGRSISISLGQTVYSGWVDVISGVGEITHGIIDMSKLEWSLVSVTYGRWASSAVPNIKSPSTGAEALNGLAEEYKIVSSNAYNNIVGTMYTPPTGVSVQVCNGSTTIKPKGNLVYELATPIPIQLTPQEVQSLLGDNIMWSDANGDLTVEYRSN